MHKIKHNKILKEKRKTRVRSKLSGTAKRPRLSVFRSNQYFYLQVINDETGKILLTANDAGKESKIKGTKTEKSQQIATNLLAKLKNKKISELVFDRGHYKYHGRVKAVAETLREGGIQI